MKELKDILLEQGIDLACKQMGLCFQRTFLADPPRWHQDNAWCVYPHHAQGLEGGLVIHSIPPEGSDKPWEEWYTLSGNPTHVWLFEQPTPQTAGHVDIGWDDFDHPLRVRGKRWYLYQAAMPKLAEKES